MTVRDVALSAALAVAAIGAARAIPPRPDADLCVWIGKDKACYPQSAARRHEMVWTDDGQFLMVDDAGYLGVATCTGDRTYRVVHHRISGYRVEPGVYDQQTLAILYSPERATVDETLLALRRQIHLHLQIARCDTHASEVDS